ncbi:MAG TPA: nucleoside-diphosphate sugar epimerase/dehydratase [Syntrophomonas sp.]|nr:nucleoside-diphosphate sugar epimerase/dehydratase [Syntrophomonas sp.]
MQNRTFRYIVLMVVDAIMVNLSVYFALLLRLDGNIPAQYLHNFLYLIPLFTIVTLAFMFGLKLYGRIWEYASLGEMTTIFRALTCSMAVAMLIIYLFKIPGLPRSVYIISWLIMNALIGASRISWRIIRGAFNQHDHDPRKNVLIIGAGDAGALLVREIHSNPYLHLNPVGIIDDDRNKRGKLLSGVTVLGNRSKIPLMVKSLQAEEIIIAMPSASGSTIREILEIARTTGARVKTLPGVYSGLKSSFVSHLREVSMEDLLRREPVASDLEEIAAYIGGKTVMVTGAGGSIGSELCRQICYANAARLVLVDNCENNLFDIEQELCHNQDCQAEILPVLMSVTNRAMMERAFRKYNPQVVFHAAAYKHVPMMESYPIEAFYNNVIGTKNATELSDIYGVQTFIMVSTDKAVNPTSVMGATKRLAELIVKDVDRTSKTTRFAVVRFGNVLGSRGSVVPTFIKQIEKGGPVTVTHPDMQRYFMTIPEAVQLIIQAGAMARGSEVFVLDMGEPVKINDLACELIRLAGWEPYRDIQIEYTGIRPGEKLYEELFNDRENMGATKHQRIFISKKDIDDKYINVGRTMQTFAKSGMSNKEDIIKLISLLLPEYQIPEGVDLSTREITLEVG